MESFSSRKQHLEASVRRNFRLFILSVVAGTSIGCEPPEVPKLPPLEKPPEKETEAEEPTVLSVPSTTWVGDDQLHSEAWYIQYLSGKRVGYFHTLVEKGDLFVEITQTGMFNLSPSGEDDGAGRRIELTSREYADGRLADFKEVITIGDKFVQISGDIPREGTKLTIKTLKSEGKQRPTTIAWKDSSWGVLGLQSMLLAQPMQPGEARTCEIFVPKLRAIIPVELLAGQPELTALPGGETTELIPVEVLMKHKQDALRSKNWITDRGVIKKTVAFGPQIVSTFLAKAERAELIRDEMLLSSFLSRSVPYKGSAASALNTKALYIVEKTIPDDADVMEANFDLYQLWDQTVRQSVKSASALSARLTVDSKLALGKRGAPSPDQVAEYLASSKYLQKDHPTIKKLVAKLEAPTDQGANGTEPDRRATALALAAALRENFLIDPLDEKFASAVGAARRLRGDAMAHAVLLSAALRHIGLPTRIAIGLKPNELNTAMVFHPWTEVWLGEEWLSLDPATGREITLECLKCNDSAFSEANPYTVLLPLFRAMPYLSVRYAPGA